MSSKQVNRTVFKLKLIIAVRYTASRYISMYVYWTTKLMRLNYTPIFLHLSSLQIIKC